MRIRRLLLWASLLVVLVTVNAMILREEHIRATGQRVLLELAPVDPRSLIQGDYMILNYAITRDDLMSSRHEGNHVVLVLDNHNVGHLSRRYQEGDRLTENEVLLRYLWTNNGIRLGVDGFFFQEGLGPYYARARYAEVSIDQRGNASLIGLRDADLMPLDSPD